MTPSSIVLLCACLASASAQQQTQLKVFVIAGQSNAEGHAEVASRNKTSGELLNGTLAYQLKDPRTAALFSQLWDNSTGNWTVLNNAKIWFNENAETQGVNGSAIPSTPADASFGSLTVGFGCGADPNLIGPELGFGFGMSSALPVGEKFLIVKTAWGGKSLAGDFRPPSSVASPDPYCQGATCPNVVGHFYEVLVEDVHKMLAPGAIAAMFPDLAGLTPVLTGLGWFHGWNDGCSENDTSAYESNFIHLVQDLRTEFNAPALAVSTAVAGFNGFDGSEATRRPPGFWPDFPPAEKVSTTCAPFARACLRLDIVLSQLAAANATRHPEMGGHMVAMETRGFWRDPQYSPNQGEGYHYWHNAETYFLAGLAMAEGMVRAMQE